MKLYLRSINIYLKKLKKKLKQRKLNIFESDMKKTWKIIKEVIGKKRGICDSFHQKINN